MRLALLALAAASGCATFAANRVALPPHAAPITTDGQPLQSTGALQLGGQADPIAPALGNPEVGLEVPRAQLHGELALRVTRNFDLEVHADDGLHDGATPLKSTQPPVDGGNVTGGGFGFTYSAETSEPGLRIAFAMRLTIWSVPYTEYRACVSNCTEDGYPTDYTDEVKGSDSIGQLALAVVPSYRTGKVTYFGGLTAANHPTLIEKGTELATDTDGNVQSGPLNVIAHAGVSLDLGGGVTASAYVAQDLATDPVRYRPSVGAAVSLPLGAD